MTDEEYAMHRLWKKDCTELITEYPFFRDGMTIAEFDAEQKAYFEFLDAGGKPWDYRAVLEQRRRPQE
ncbi:hypothetical protein GMD88_17495 [Pseudoflavonifractor sp. BIOML-A6]|nr:MULTISPECIES: hypothetical protein [unclassified Pseudoflavonifractor]KAB4866222.1 hypothetical protein GAG84_27055 [Bacteroides thetaiotaomicron]MTQ98591.1 hypothetical protein [Pseudoflavonifractor sp. BIOML-A16]MTR07866.1 hypothetical protein [Pseudoflavonifractor sp. BIOML-A15]MTR34057.1 hypothetical protein [Pseudoflavonifractor sp. BIOML-A14]MTR74815.1 hypothetical protein [Pseudoflavonifractor sp. BIOML-A18]MTS66042.1 hypothetical protein [Pseudoflavonifractor sp. BIOML-A5]MTS73360